MLQGKRIIVTGAAQGIGAAMATGFAARGAQVLVSDISDPEPVAARIRADGGSARAVVADVAKLADCRAMAAAAEEAFGGVDGMVCNAALFTSLDIEPYDEIDEATWDRVMAVNVKGPWFCTQAVAPAMERAGGGSIVMIATNRIFHGYANLLHYDASKGAMLAMTRSLIRELGSREIRVNTIAPGLTMSEGVLARDGIQDRKGAIARSRSLARDQTPEDLVGPTAFFLSDQSAFVSGQSLIVDGGGIVN